MHLVAGMSMVEQNSARTVCLSDVVRIGVARGCSECTCTPQGGEKIFRRNLQEKCVSAPPGHEVHPQPEQESIFRTVFVGRVRFGSIFRRSLRATTKKRSSTFLARKSAPPRQNPGYAYGSAYRS